MSTLPATTAAPAIPKRAWQALIVLLAGMFIALLDTTIVNVALPSIRTSLDASEATLSWIISGYALSFGLVLIPAGRLGDRIGHKWVFFTGLALFTVASLACGLAQNDLQLIIARVVQGFAGALLQPASLAILRNTFPAEKLNMAIGIWAGTSGLAIGSGPIVAGLLIENASWEWVFFLNAPVAALAIALSLWVVRQSRDEEAAGSFDLPGVALLSTALFALVWGLIKAQNYGFGDVLPLSFFALAVALGIAFLIREDRAAHPLMPLGLFRNRSFAAGTVLAMLGFFALFGAFFFLTLYLQQVHGMSPVDAGVRLLPMTGTFIVSAPVAGLLTARFGPRPTLVAGMVLTAMGLFALSRITVDASYLSLWPWFIVIGFGFGFVLVSSTEAIVGNAPAHQAGLAGGIQQTAAQLGGVLGTTIFGTVLATRVGDVLADKLSAAGVPAQAVPGLTAAKDYVAQGVAPVPPGAPTSLADAITTGSHQAFMSGFQSALTVGSLIALVAAAVALLVKRGDSATASVPAGV